LIYIQDKNESWTAITSENKEFLYKIMEQLEVFVDGYKFTPQFRAGIWDGKKKFYTVQSGYLIIAKGLIPNILKFIKDNGQEYTYDKQELYPDVKVTPEEFEDFILSLNLPFQPYDYQKQIAIDSINRRRLVARAATSAGKSMAIYLIVRFMYSKGIKVVLIVPTISLTLQMKGDFLDYGWTEANDEVHLIGGEFNIKHFDKPVTISTWQSLQRNTHLFDTVGCVIVDESHKAKAEVIADVIVPSAEQSPFRIGLTGTPPRNAVDKLTVLGALGPVKTYITAQGLIDRGLATPVKINTLFLNYSEEDRKIVANFKKYQDEESFITTHKSRNLKVSQIANKLSTKGNTLLLIDKIAHGKELLSNILYYKLGKRTIIISGFGPKAIQDEIDPYIGLDVLFCYNGKLEEKAVKNLIKVLGDDYSTFKQKFIELETQKVFWISGAISGSQREYIRHFLETTTGIIIVATYSTTSTGSNFKNLHNIILGSSTKSFIRLNQTIGRGMRKHSSKEKVEIFDIVDDLSLKNKRGTKKENFILRHFNERLTEYLDSEYPIKEIEIQLD
jgi:superfamily II DNA or RNA helicase